MRAAATWMIGGMILKTEKTEANLGITGARNRNCSDSRHLSRVPYLEVNGRCGPSQGSIRHGRGAAKERRC